MMMAGRLFDGEPTLTDCLLHLEAARIRGSTLSSIAKT